MLSGRLTPAGSLFGFYGVSSQGTLRSEPIPNFLHKVMAMRNLFDHSQMMSALSLKNLKVREVTA